MFWIIKIFIKRFMSSSERINNDQLDATNNVSGSLNDSNTFASLPLQPGEQLVNGDRQCPGKQLMCVTGIVNGSFVNYELQSTGFLKTGWMAIGFGTKMSDTPIVIMWPNNDGTITWGQREAPGLVMPTPVTNPPLMVTPRPELSQVSGSEAK